MSEEETIEIIEKLQCEYKEQQNDKKYNDYTVFKAKEYSKGLQGLLDLYNKEKEKNTLINHLYKNLKDDFDSYKKDKDINYLDNNHHKKLVEKSIGQIINKPEECWFDAVEVKIIRNNILYGVNIDKDFITLKEISDEHPDICMTVIAESPLSGAIYRYNNYGKKEWQLIGTMYGYA